MKNKPFWDRLVGHFNFERLVTPLLIRLAYGAGVICILGAGVGSLFAAIRLPAYGAMQAMLAVGGTLLALLLWRLINELGILAFNLHARLTEIRDLLMRRRAYAGIRPNASESAAAETP